MRRTSVAAGETDEANRVPGASGTQRKPRRPGRAASLLSANATKRSNRWRNPDAGGPRRRRGNLAKKAFAGRGRRSLQNAAP